MALPISLTFMFGLDHVEIFAGDVLGTEYGTGRLIAAVIDRGTPEEIVLAGNGANNAFENAGRLLIGSLVALVGGDGSIANVLDELFPAADIIA